LLLHIGPADLNEALLDLMPRITERNTQCPYKKFSTLVARSRRPDGSL
jgi:hypothetical protein